MGVAEPIAEKLLSEKLKDCETTTLVDWGMSFLVVSGAWSLPPPKKMKHVVLP